MKKYINGKYIELTSEEIAAMQAEAEAFEREHWLNTPYDDLVDAEIRKQYTVSQEFAILRQRDEKPMEYAAYYEYCEQCKNYVKQQKAKYEA